MKSKLAQIRDNNITKAELFVKRLRLNGTSKGDDKGTLLLKLRCVCTINAGETPLRPLIFSTCFLRSGECYTLFINGSRLVASALRRGDRGSSPEYDSL